MKPYLLQIILFLFCQITQAQILSGKVIDQSSKEPISYVHIGIEGKNLGTISDDNGNYQLKLDKTNSGDTIIFSSIGYQRREIVLTADLQLKMTIELEPQNYNINEIKVSQKKIRKKKFNTEKKIGRKKVRSNYTGSSGLGWGGEIGIKIRAKNKIYKIKDLNFNVSKLNFDSVLFRVNVYSMQNGLPSESILTKNVFLKGYYQESWISKNLEAENIFIEEDVVITLEVIKGWKNPTRSAGIFFSNGLFYNSKAYLKFSSMDRWRVEKEPKLSLFLTVEQYKGYK